MTSQHDHGFLSILVLFSAHVYGRSQLVSTRSLIMINSEIIEVNSKSHENEGKTNKRASTDDKMMFTFLVHVSGNLTNGNGDLDYDIPNL